MLSKKIEAALNGQVAIEAASSQAYSPWPLGPRTKA
jgi:ferritin